MNICYIINERNASIFGKSLVDASEENNYKGYIFRFSNAITVDENRNLLLDLLNKEAIDKIISINYYYDQDKNQPFLTDKILKQYDCRLWLWDSLTDIGIFKKTISRYVKIYSIESHDQFVCKKNFELNCCYLPLFAGSIFYHSVRNVMNEQDIDILFIGTVNNNKYWLKILKAVAELAQKRNYTFKVCGRLWHNDHLYQRIIGKIKFSLKYPILAKYVKNESVSPEEAVVLYKRTKINLNIHIPEHSGYNCCTFEVLGNDNFLITDKKNRENLQFEENKTIVTYSTENELIEKIEYFMKNKKERNSIARQAGALVRANYILPEAIKKLVE